MIFSRDGINFTHSSKYTGNYKKNIDMAIKSLGIKNGETLFIKDEAHSKVLELKIKK